MRFSISLALILLVGFASGSAQSVPSSASGPALGRKAVLARTALSRLIFLLDFVRSGRHIFRQGQAEPEDGSVAQFAVYPDAPSVIQNNVLNNRQTQPGPAGLARAGFIDSIKALK